MRHIDFRYDLLPLKNRLFRLALRITLDHAEAEDSNMDHNLVHSFLYDRVL